MTTGPNKDGKNDHRLDDLRKVAALLGTEAGRGKDTRVKFHLAIVEAAFNRVIDAVADKHGLGKDDAAVLTEDYVRAQNGATVFDAKAPNQSKEISCARTCIRLGQYTKGGQGEPLGTVNELMNIRRKLRASPAHVGRVKDADNTLLDFARKQFRRESMIEKEELEALCLKPNGEARTGEDIIESARRQLQNLHNGKVSGSTAKDASPLITTAVQALTARLIEIAEARKGSRGARAA